MSFRWFRKYEKVFLWGAVIFSVAIFVTFSGFGDLQNLLSGQGGGEVAGQFVVASTGESREVPIEEYIRTRSLLNKLVYRSRGEAVNEDEIWQHLMLLADAEGAGIDVAKAEVVQAVTGGRPMTKEEYRAEWSLRQFASGREYEGLWRDLLKVNRWVEWSTQAARIVDLDEVYVRWKADNERRDLEALVFPDRMPEDIDDPSADTVRAWYDEQTQSYRDERYKEDARFDLLQAWVPLDAGQDVVPDSVLADLPAHDPAEIDARFEALRAERWPDLAEPDEALRATLGRELRLLDHVQRVLSVFESRADKSAETFRETMEAGGLTVDDSDGPLGTDELKALPGGDELLPLYLNGKSAGDTHFGRAMATPKVGYALYLQEVVPARPLSFDEAYDKVVADWKQRQRDQVARDFRDRIREETRKLPEVAELIAPLEAAASQRADEAIAADAELDEAGKAKLREEIMDEAELREILPRLAEHEHKVWAQVPRPEGVETLTLAGVSRAYRNHPDDALEAADSIERYLKTNSRLFSLGVDAISEPLRFAPGGQTAIVRITGRAFPEQAEMLADAEGLEASRKTLASQREAEARNEFTPDRLKTTHQLQLRTPDAEPEQ